MALFFFHVIGSSTVQDETGQQLVDVEDAKTRACIIAKELAQSENPERAVAGRN
jgi:hypothetical protein